MDRDVDMHDGAAFSFPSLYSSRHPMLRRPYYVSEPLWRRQGVLLHCLSSIGLSGRNGAHMPTYSKLTVDITGSLVPPITA
jgi:hypothetical protein